MRRASQVEWDSTESALCCLLARAFVSTRVSCRVVSCVHVCLGLGMSRGVRESVLGWCCACPVSRRSFPSRPRPRARRHHDQAKAKAKAQRAGRSAPALDPKLVGRNSQQRLLAVQLITLHPARMNDEQCGCSSSALSENVYMLRNLRSPLISVRSSGVALRPPRGRRAESRGGACRLFYVCFHIHRTFV